MVLKTIPNPSAQSCYLFYGEEEWLKSKAIKEIQSTTVGLNDLMNTHLFEGKDFSVSSLIEVGETMPFFAAQKFILVRESNLFKTGRKDDTQLLVEWLKKLPDYVILVFAEKEIDKRNALYKWMQKNGSVQEYSYLDVDARLSQVKQLLLSKNLVLTQQVLNYFISNMPPSLHYINGELEKLSAFADSGEITCDTINEVCTFSLEQRVFELIKKMVNKDATSALKIYHKLIESKESPIAVLVLIGRQYRMLLQTKYLLSTKHDAFAISKAIGVPAFVVKEMIKEVNFYSFKQLEDIIANCLESDFAIKSGQMEQNKCVELLILKCITI